MDCVLQLMIQSNFDIILLDFVLIQCLLILCHEVAIPYICRIDIVRYCLDFVIICITYSIAHSLEWNH